MALQQEAPALCAGFFPLASREKDQKRIEIVKVAAEPDFSRELRAGNRHQLLGILSLNGKRYKITGSSQPHLYPV